jgi:LmeA-like phospholipid-binding
MESNSSGQIISKILSPALQFWLRSQVEQVKALQFKIQGQDRQILRGYIPGVYLQSQEAIYQGLHLDQIEILAQNIRINIGQILRGKPFRLLEPVQVSGCISIEESDLQASLCSVILCNALNDLLLLLLESSGVSNGPEIFTQGNLSWQNVELGIGQFKLQGIWTEKHQETYIFTLVSDLKVFGPQVLYLSSLELRGLPEPYQVSLNEIFIDLGTDVEFSSLLISQGQLKAEGKALIRN